MTRPMTFRVVFMGDSQVGKSSLIHRFFKNEFDNHLKNTVCASYYAYEETINDRKVIMQIWDTAGQEKYRSLGPIYYRNATVGIAVLDVTQEDSLSKLEKWIEEFLLHTENPLLYIVGNKIDLIPILDRTKTDKIKEFAKEKKAEWFFTSAKTGENVSQLFLYVFKKLVKNHKSAIYCQKPLESKKEENCC